MPLVRSRPSGWFAVGPVRFDYAHNPDREPGERDWMFHISIGYPF